MNTLKLNISQLTFAAPTDIYGIPESSITFEYSEPLENGSIFTKRVAMHDIFKNPVYTLSIQNKHIIASTPRYGNRNGIVSVKTQPISGEKPRIARLFVDEYCVFDGDFLLNHADTCILPFIGDKMTPPDLVAFLPNGKWTIVSQQFKRFCTIIAYENHASYKKKSVYELENYFLSGNRLVVDAWTRHRLACQQNNLEQSYEESTKRFFVQRHERVAGVDYYALLALHFVYKKLPTTSNIPTTALNTQNPGEFEPQRLRWDERSITAFLELLPETLCSIVKKGWDKPSTQPAPNAKKTVCIFNIDWDTVDDEVLSTSVFTTKSVDVFKKEEDVRTKKIIEQEPEIKKKYNQKVWSNSTLNKRKVTTKEEFPVLRK